jgi:hypothetical protein
MKYFIAYTHINIHIEFPNEAHIIMYTKIDESDLEEVFGWELFFTIKDLFKSGKNKNISLLLKDKHVRAIYYLV